MRDWVRLKDCLEKCVEHSKCEAFLLHHAKTGQMGDEYNRVVYEEHGGLMSHPSRSPHLLKSGKPHNVRTHLCLSEAKQ